MPIPGITERGLSLSVDLFEPFFGHLVRSLVGTPCPQIDKVLEEGLGEELDKVREEALRCYREFLLESAKQEGQRGRNDTCRIVGYPGRRQNGL